LIFERILSTDSLHWSRRHGDTTCTLVFSDVGLADLGPLLSLLKILLSLSVLGKIDGSNLFCLLNLLLVGLDLLLEFVNKVSDTVLVLLVLFLLEQKLLDASLTLGDGLVHLVGHLDGSVQLKLDVTGPGLQFSGNLSSSTGHGEGSFLGLLLHLRKGDLS